MSLKTSQLALLLAALVLALTPIGHAHEGPTPTTTKPEEAPLEGLDELYESVFGVALDEPMTGPTRDELRRRLGELLSWPNRQQVKRDRRWPTVKLLVEQYDQVYSCRQTEYKRLVLIGTRHTGSHLSDLLDRLQQQMSLRCAGQLFREASVRCHEPDLDQVETSLRPLLKLAGTERDWASLEPRHAHQLAAKFRRQASAKTRLKARLACRLLEGKLDQASMRVGVDTYFSQFANQLYWNLRNGDHERRLAKLWDTCRALEEAYLEPEEEPAASRFSLGAMLSKLCSSDCQQVHEPQVLTSNIPASEINHRPNQVSLWKTVPK